MTPFNKSMFEETDYLSCNCFPSCIDITYNVKSSSIPLSLSELFWERNNYSIKNHSVLHIYFQNLGVTKLRQDVLYYWHDLMNIYVNVWNLFLGISIINIIEIIYKYILFRSDTTSQSTAHIEEKIKENKDVMQVTTIIIKPAIIPEIAQPLHWEELTGRQLYPSSLLLNPSSKQ